MVAMRTGKGVQGLGHNVFADSSRKIAQPMAVVPESMWASTTNLAAATLPSFWIRGFKASGGPCHSNCTVATTVAERM